MILIPGPKRPLCIFYNTESSPLKKGILFFYYVVKPQLTALSPCLLAAVLWSRDIITLYHAEIKKGNLVSITQTSDT